MKSLSRDIRKIKECKRKRENDDNNKDEVRIEKQLKCNNDFDTNTINLENNVDESAGFFDEYCQILLKDNGNQGQSNVSIDPEIIVDKEQGIFNGINRLSLSVKLKNWAVKHVDTIKAHMIDELLIILRDEGYLELPTTGQALISEAKGQEGGNSDKERQGTEDLERVDVWIKKEESCESMWNNEENNSSETLSHDEIDNKMSSDVICPDFAVTDFINDDGKNKNYILPEKNSEFHGTRFYGVVKEELHKMEQRWARQLESTKRSLLYDMVRKYEDLKNRIGISTRPLGTCFTDDKEILGVRLPFLDVDAFCEFDEAIGDNPEKEIATKSLMTTLCFGAASLSNSIGCILSAFLAKDVQMQYSACGKKIRGIKKRNFGDTNTFRYAKDVLREKHGTSDAEIVSKTSRWFTGAGDRDGGRKERRNK